MSAYEGVLGIEALSKCAYTGQRRRKGIEQYIFQCYKPSALRMQASERH